MPDHGLEVFARRSGYILGVVYVEKNDSNLAAFHTLMSEVQRLEATGVLVLSLPTPIEALPRALHERWVVVAHNPP